MKTLYGSTFINKQQLKEEGIDHTIKLEYYKIINMNELEENNKEKFGINIVKTEYMKNDTKIEEKEIKYLSNDEQKVNNVLNILKRNKVTPVCIKDIILDLSNKILFL